ncbi:MAG: transcriptional regulator [Cyanobacteria bacterium J06626_18]
MEFTPKVIESEAEYERTLSIVERLTFDQNRTSEESALHKLLVMLVKTYEAERYPMPQSSPDEILRHIMEASGTRQVDLVGILISSGVVSKIVNGKRAINTAQAKILSELFKVFPELFI